MQTCYVMKMFRGKQEKKPNILPKATKIKQTFTKKRSETANESKKFFADRSCTCK